MHNAQVSVFDGTYYKMMLNDIGVAVTLFRKISFPVKHLMPYYAKVAVLAPNHLTLWRTLVSFALCIEGMCYFQQGGGGGEGDFKFLIYSQCVL